LEEQRKKRNSVYSYYNILYRKVKRKIKHNIKYERKKEVSIDAILF